MLLSSRWRKIWKKLLQNRKKFEKLLQNGEIFEKAGYMRYFAYNSGLKGARITGTRERSLRPRAFARAPAKRK